MAGVAASRSRIHTSGSIALLLVAVVFSSGCSKSPGYGGDASITGVVITRDYNSTFTQIIAEYPAEDEYVYIKYGTHPGYDDRVKTDYAGEFEFKFLYEGNYEIYVYSRDSTLQDPNDLVPVIKKVEINGRKESINLGEIIKFE
jgi:hypothetical protein